MSASKKIPTLYKRRSDQKIQQWSIIVSGDKKKVISGIQGGKLVETEWTVCLPKNEGKINSTTGSEQAEKEAWAEWELQKKAGYFESVDEVDTKREIPKPMLAKSFEDYRDKISFPLISLAKVDGVRCIATQYGLFSRNGEQFVSAPHIEEQLAPLFKKNPGLMLDGELYNHDYKEDFNSIIKIVRKKNVEKSHLHESKRVLQYHIFDVISHRGVFSERYAFIEELAKYFGPSIGMVKATLCNDQDELDKMYSAYLLQGFEGQMIRIDEVYENKRSKFLLKRKEFQTEEFSVIEIKEGIGNASGIAATVVLEDSRGQRFEATLKGSREHRQEILKGKTPKICTVRFQNYTPPKANGEGSVPRFPIAVDFDRSE